MDMHRLRAMLCDELEAVSNGKMTADKINLIDKITHAIKSIDTIKAMENEGYSNRYSRNNSYESSYNNYNRGSYGRGNNYDRSYNSYDDGYSRDDMSNAIRGRLAEMLDNTTNEQERDAIRRTMNMM